MDEKGENSIIVVPGANGYCSKADVDALRPYLEKAKMLMLQLEIPLETVEYAVSIARSCGTRVMLDPAPPVPLSEELLRGIDILTPNEHEASFLTGRQVVDVESARLAASDLLNAGARAVVIKLGGRGLVYAEEGNSGSIPGHRVRRRHHCSRRCICEGPGQWPRRRQVTLKKRVGSPTRRCIGSYARVHRHLCRNAVSLRFFSRFDLVFAWM